MHFTFLIRHVEAHTFLGESIQTVSYNMAAERDEVDIYLMLIKFTEHTGRRVICSLNS